MTPAERYRPTPPTISARHAALVRRRFDTAAHQTRYTRQHTEVIPGVTVTTEEFQRKLAELVQKAMASDGSII